MCMIVGSFLATIPTTLYDLNGGFQGVSKVTNTRLAFGEFWR